jgi:hypothetical protein
MTASSLPGGGAVIFFYTALFPNRIRRFLILVDNYRQGYNLLIKNRGWLFFIKLFWIHILQLPE